MSDEPSNRPLRPKSVAIVGNAKIHRDSLEYSLAYECGALLMEHNFRVVTGGMGGVMEAASLGARESSAWTPGNIIALLPGSNPNDAHQWADVVIPTGLDHLRNAMVAQSDAVVAIGGGAGTLSEIAFAWIHYRLIVALRVSGWSGKLADQRIDSRVRYQDLDDDRVFGADDAKDAVKQVSDRIEQYTRRHRSIR